MKKLAIIVLALTLGACTFVNPFTSVSNPVSTTNLYEGELVFDASLKTFDQLKSLCATRVLPRDAAGSDHSLSRFDDQMPEVLAFAGLSARCGTR